MIYRRSAFSTQQLARGTWNGSYFCEQYKSTMSFHDALTDEVAIRFIRLVAQATTKYTMHNERHTAMPISQHAAMTSFAGTCGWSAVERVRANVELI